MEENKRVALSSGKNAYNFNNGNIFCTFVADVHFLIQRFLSAGLFSKTLKVLSCLMNSIY